MFIEITSDNATFLQSFTPIVITVYAGTDTSTLLSEVPTVSASFVDSGITVTTATALVTIAGRYESILPIMWYWKDLNDVLQSGRSAPAAGTYLKLVQVDSPPITTEDCIYTISSSEGSAIFTHTVNAGYDIISNELTTLLSGQPGP
jgi:hypothetical protein